MTPELLISEVGPVATMAFNRPSARNSLSVAMLQELASAIHGLAGREDLRVIVLRGAGELPFSAGYDMRELPADALLTADDARAIHQPVRAAADAIAASPHIVVGAARKYAFGAGFDVFLHCDLRICSEDARFCMPPNRHGFLYPMEGLARLTALAGLSRASWMLLTGLPVQAHDALRDGIVQQLVSDANFEADLKALCETLAGNAPLSMRETKRLLQQASSVRESDEKMYDRMAFCLNSDDVREAMRAFREKRTPVFRGR